MLQPQCVVVDSESESEMWGATPPPPPRQFPPLHSTPCWTNEYTYLYWSEYISIWMILEISVCLVLFTSRTLHCIHFTIGYSVLLMSQGSAVLNLVPYGHMIRSVWINLRRLRLWCSQQNLVRDQGHVYGNGYWFSSSGFSVLSRASLDF